MKKTIGVWLALFAALSLAACGHHGDGTLGLVDRHYDAVDRLVEISEDAAYNAEEQQPIEIAEDRIDVPDKKIIRDGYMTIRVDDLGATKRHVDSLVRHMDAYYATESFYEQSYSNSYSLVIRIPSANFDRFIAELESGGGKVLSKNLDARDVTDQFTDIELRLANKRNYLKRYQELVRQAKDVKEILEIEEIIRKLEEEIESAEGRLRLLKSQVAYSTLTLTITAPTDYKYTPEPQKNFLERIKEALSGGWHAIVSVVVVLFYLWPFAVVAIVVLIVLLRVKKKKNRI